MIYRRVLKYYRGFLTRSLIALGFSFTAIGLNLLKPWPFKIIVDQILPGRLNVFQFAFPPLFGSAIKTPTLDTTRAIALLCLAMIVIQLLWSLLSLASNYMFVKIGLQSLLRLRTELYAHLQRLSLKFHDTRRSADSSFRVAYDSQAIQTIYNKGFTNIVSSGVTLLGTFAVMLRLDWQLTLLSLAIVPLLIGTIYFFAKRIRTQSTTIQEQDSALLTQTQEGLSSIRMVHAFGREDFEVSQFHEQAHGSLQANLRLTMTNVKSALVISTLIVIGTAAMYFVGSLHVLAGTLSLGVLLVFIAYLVMLYQPLESLTYTAWAMEGATAGARRCFEVLDRTDDVVDAPGAKEISETSGALGFENVSFSYGPQPVLQDINLSIAPNQIIALVGGTGAGKSTLLSLVPRFYDPNQGNLTLDGCDLRQITKKSLRDKI